MDAKRKIMIFLKHDTLLSSILIIMIIDYDVFNKKETINNINKL